tara:strand:+ start:447 stop:1028 length:582 start_codon:yes stop_codon:yes gene_type:complete
LNEGLYEVFNVVRDSDPEPVIYTDTFNIVADDELVPFPTNMESISEVFYRGSSAAAYTRIDFRQRYATHSVNGSGGSTSSTQVSYSVEGRYIRLDPTPPSAVTAGVKLKYVPILSMGSDTEVPPLPASIHRGVVFAAQILALSDTSDTSEKKDMREELDRFLVRLKTSYETNRDQDEFIAPDSDLKLYPDGFA